MKRGDLIDVKIEKLVYKGMGMGSVNGKRIFIPFSLPEERLFVKIGDIKKDYITGQIINILERSQFRKDPICPIFTICGGCHLQHIDYDYQLRLKEEVFTDLLRKIGRIRDVRISKKSLIKESIASKNPFFYRNRVQLKIKSDNKSIMGFYKQGSHDIVEVNKCFIADPSINSLIERLKPFLIDINIPLRGLDIATDGINILVSINMDRDIKNIKDIDNIHAIFMNSFKEIKGIKIEVGNKGRYFGEYYLSYRLNNVDMIMSGDIFSQVNPYQNIELIKLVLKIAGLSGREKLLDLYAGAGNLTIPLAMNSKYVVAVEKDKKAVEHGRLNARLNNINNCEFIQGDVKKILNNLRECFNLIIIDPPREGCKNIIDKLNSKKIIYISCDPATLARDINIFCSLAYSIKDIYLIDMFPNTYHIEGIITIEKN